MKQLMIRFKIIEWESLNGEKVPPHYDIDLLGPLELSQVAYWDEMHKNLVVGTGNGAVVQTIFKRYDAGGLSDNGTFYDEV